MDPLRAGLKVIRGHGPHFLPVTWRVLDELTDPYDSPVGVPSHSHRGWSSERLRASSRSATFQAGAPPCGATRCRGGMIPRGRTRQPCPTVISGACICRAIS